MPSLLLHHRPHRAWSGTGTFYTGEVGIPYGGWCNGADFTEISKFPEILGELSMRKQCVPGSFLSAHALEPGNEATPSHEEKGSGVTTLNPLPSYRNVKRPIKLQSGIYWNNAEVRTSTQY